MRCFMINFISTAKTILLSCLLAAAPSVAMGGSSAFLKIPTGARPAALAGAFSAFRGSADSVAYNPGSLAFMADMQVSLMRANYIGGIKHDWLSFSRPHKNDSVSAFALNSMSIGSIDSYADDGVPTGSVSSSDLALTVAHSRKIDISGSGLFKEAGLGLSFKYITERLDTERANAVAMDFGILAESAVKGLDFSLVAENLGTKMKFIEESSHLPSRLKAGVVYGQAIFDIECAYSAEMLIPSDGKRSFRGGLEAVVRDQFSFRAGWQNSRDLGSPLTYGLGYRFDAFGKADMSIDYAFADYGEFGNVHRFGLTLRFARNRAVPLNPGGAEDKAASPAAAAETMEGQAEPERAEGAAE